MTKAMNTLYYSKISGDLTELIDLKEFMAKQLLEDETISNRVEKEDDVAFLQKMVTKTILDGRPKKNLTRTQETDFVMQNHNQFITSSIQKTSLATHIKLANNLVADYFFKGYRSTKINIPDMRIHPETIFEVKKLTNMWSNEKFSLGFSSIQSGKLIGFSLSVVPATTGQKGQAQCLLTCLTHDEYIIDDGAKYLDLTELIKNMSV